LFGLRSREEGILAGDGKGGVLSIRPTARGRRKKKGGIYYWREKLELGACSVTCLKSGGPPRNARGEKVGASPGKKVETERHQWEARLGRGKGGYT